MAMRCGHPRGRRAVTGRPRWRPPAACAMLRVSVALLLGLVSGAPAHRRNSTVPTEACGFNGAGSPCVCSPPWQGPTCSQLSLRPVNSSRLGFHVDGSSTWGGSVLRDENGTYWMWSSLMDGHCGLGAWNRQSTVVLARSSHPAGPYEQVKSLFPAFSHEPSATRAPTGEYVVHFTSTAYGCPIDEKPGWGSCVSKKFGGGPGIIGPQPGGEPGCVCDDNVSWHDRCTGNLTIALDPATQFPTLMSWASHPLGPWSKPVVVYNGSDGSTGAPRGEQATGDTNFAGVINANGSMVGMWRGFGGPNSAPGTKAGRTSMGCPNVNTSNSRGCPGHSFGQYPAHATHWRQAGSYHFGHATRASNVFPKLENSVGQNCNIEDPTLWVDAGTGVYHAIVHQVRKQSLSLSLFPPTFYAKNDDFTQTGSGQT
jgi:hypothetical protein